MKHLEIALKEYGQKEIVGDQHNPRIVKYSTDIGNTWVSTDEVHWCSEFVNWCLLQAGIQGTKSAVARSFLKWGDETKTPQLGDLAVLWRPPQGSTNGHIGFYIADTQDGKGVFLLGGNQNDEVNIKAFPKEQVISFRRVPDISKQKEEIINRLIVLMGQLSQMQK